jgi:hypothetical protein
MGQVSTWVLATSSVLIGSLSTFGVEFSRRRWADRAEAKRRVAERSEAAAKEILEMLDEARDLLDIGREEEVEDAKVHSLGHRIDRAALLLSDPTARTALAYVTEAIWEADTGIAQYLGHSPMQVAHRICEAGHQVLGAVLRGEQVTCVPTTLVEYHETVQGFHRDLDDAYAEARREEEASP